MVRLVDDEHVEREPAGTVELPDLAVHVPQQPLGARLSAATPSRRSPAGTAGTGSRADRGCGAPAAISSLLTITNSRPNFSRISSCHFSARLGGQTTTTDRARCRSSSSWITSPASMVLPSPTSSASSRFVRGACKRPAQRLELVGLDVRAAAERRLIGVRVGRGHRTPTHRVDERGQGVRVVERGRIDLRKPLVRGDRVADLQLPDHRQLLAQPVLVERLERHDVIGPRLRLVGWAAGKSLLPDVRDCPGRAAYLDHLALLRDRRQVCEAFSR